MDFIESLPWNYILAIGVFFLVFLFIAREDKAKEDIKN